MRQSPIPARAWALLLLLALLWGASFLANRRALEEVGVLTTVAVRVGLGAVVLWLWVGWRRLPLPPLRRALPAFLAMGILNNAIPFTLIVWGQTRIDSGLAAILNATTALFAVAVAAAVHADERMTGRKALGVATGFAGVALAIGPSALLTLDLAAVAQLAVLGAALSYACAAVFARRALAGVAPEVAAAGMLTAAAALLLPAALLVDGAPPHPLESGTWAALLYLALAAGALAYLLYYRILALAGAGTLGLVTLLIPPVALILGAATYGEALPPRAFAGFALIAAGLLVLDGRLLRRGVEESA